MCRFSNALCGACPDKISTSLLTILVLDFVIASAVVLRLPARPAFGDIVASLGGSSACLSDSNGVLCESDATGDERGAAGTSSCSLLAIDCLFVDIGRIG